MNNKTSSPNDRGEKETAQSNGHYLCGLFIFIATLFLGTFLVVYFSVIENDSQCIQKFGKELGQDSTGVVGYSNCNDKIVSYAASYLQDDAQTYCGMKWQCVEYSRRWLIVNNNVTFDSVDIAAQIWDLPAVTSVKDSLITYPFAAYPSGISTTAPWVGCLLIYNVDLAPTGHVAVIVDVNLSSEVVYIAEQNWSNDIWIGPTYARSLNISVNGTGFYTIQEEYLIGWKCALL
jgi:hypothetical protein